MYASNGETDTNGDYIVEADAAYLEPEVFEQSGNTLKLVNYKFAYGNRMSDIEDNPYSV